MIHSVLFKLKYSAGSEEANNFWNAVKKLADIPGVQNFKYLIQTNQTNKFGYGLSMEFDNQIQYDNYSNHPEHVQFIEQFWMKDVEDFLEIDYEDFDE